MILGSNQNWFVGQGHLALGVQSDPVINLQTTKKKKKKRNAKKRWNLLRERRKRKRWVAKTEFE